LVCNGGAACKNGGVGGCGKRCWSAALCKLLSASELTGMTGGGCDAAGPQNAPACAQNCAAFAAHGMEYMAAMLLERNAGSNGGMCGACKVAGCEAVRCCVIEAAASIAICGTTCCGVGS